MEMRLREGSVERGSEASGRATERDAQGRHRLNQRIIGAMTRAREKKKSAKRKESAGES